MGLIIKDVSVYIPRNLTNNDILEHQIFHSGIPLSKGTFERVFGIQTRAYARRNEQVSDMAIKAAAPLWKKYEKADIDLLLFAAASSDMIEPATASIIHHKMGLLCPAMDIKNACNSFVSAMHISQAFLKAGTYKRILIVTAEKLSDTIRFKPRNIEEFKGNIAAFSFGDAAAAVIVEQGPEEKGIQYEQLYTNGQYWDLCCIQGGGSAFPRDPDKTFFSGKTHLLKKVFVEHGMGLVNQALEACSWKIQDVDHLITHQVSADSLKEIVTKLELPPEKCVNVFHKYGNTAAVSIPLALYTVIKEKKVKPGDKVLILGLAAGINISVHCMIW